MPSKPTTFSAKQHGSSKLAKSSLFVVLLGVLVSELLSYVCDCACVCACASAGACVRACACMCVCVCVVYIHLM